MTVRGVLAALLIAGAAYGAARLDDVQVGVVVAAVAAIAGALLWEWLHDRRLRRVTEQVNSVLGGASETIPVDGFGARRRFAIALNALIAAYRRRGARLAAERPWRHDLVDSLTQPALLFSAEARLLSANGPARELLGIADDAVGITVVQAVGSAPLADAVREAQAADRPVTVDVEHAGHHLRASASRVGDETLLIILDRTRELRVEEIRRNFVVNASHELKTPVTSIQTLAEALQVTIGRDPQRAATLTRQLNEEAERLARLVRDLLDLRRLEEGGPLERVPVDLAVLVRAVVADQASRAEAHEVAISVDAPDHTVVAGVPADLEVVVQNLVVNAVQYNRPGGSVEVSVRSEAGTVVITVRDTGIGIPRQDLSRVFERFYRVDTARSRATGGTGLGLSIVRNAVERNGGSVRVESLLGEGSTFTVELPIGAPD